MRGAARRAATAQPRPICDNSGQAIHTPGYVVSVIILGRNVPDELISAILGCHPVRFRYLRRALTSAPRVVRPHALYESSPRKISLSGVQLSGPTSQASGDLPGWRMFDVSMIADPQVLPGVFAVDRGFRPRSPRFGRLILDCRDGWAEPADAQPERRKT
jgi:hypothetical protein